MDLSEYFNSSEFKDLLKPFYNKVRSNSERSSDQKYLDFKVGVQTLTSRALLYYQQFMFKKESSQLIEENFHAFMRESVEGLFDKSNEMSENDMETMMRYYKLNNPDKTWESETQINREFIENIVKSASKYHAFNSAFEEGIRENGVNPNAKPFNEEEIKNISELLSQYNCPLSLGCSGSSVGCVYYSTTPSVIPSYGNTSPEWFNEFCAQNLSRKDYDKARQHIISTCDAVNMPSEDAGKVLAFFEKNWSMFAVETSPKVVMVSQGYDDNMVASELEFCEMYDYNPIYAWVAYNSDGVNVETKATIDVANAEFINMPEVNELLKGFHQEYNKEQEEVLKKTENWSQKADLSAQITTVLQTNALPVDINDNLVDEMER